MRIAYLASREPIQGACVWQSTSPGVTTPAASIAIGTPASGRRTSRRGPTASIAPPRTTIAASSITPRGSPAEARDASQVTSRRAVMANGRSGCCAASARAAPGGAVTSPPAARAARACSMSSSTARDAGPPTISANAAGDETGRGGHRRRRPRHRAAASAQRSRKRGSRSALRTSASCTRSCRSSRWQTSSASHPAQIGRGGGLLDGVVRRDRGHLEIVREEHPSKPISPRRRSAQMARGQRRRDAGIQRLDDDVRRHERRDPRRRRRRGTAAARSRSRRPRPWAMVGSARWLSSAVSPCPGSACRRRARPPPGAPPGTRRARRATAPGSRPNARSPMIGFAGLESTSSTGAKFRLMPTARSSDATAARRAAQQREIRELAERAHRRQRQERRGQAGDAAPS